MDYNILYEVIAFVCHIYPKALSTLEPLPILLILKHCNTVLTLLWAVFTLAWAQLIVFSSLYNQGLISGAKAAVISPWYTYI